MPPHDVSVRCCLLLLLLLLLQVILDRLLPAYLALGKDEIWGVRKACAESLVLISEAVSPEVRQEHLFPLLEALLDDHVRPPVDPLFPEIC